MIYRWTTKLHVSPYGNIATGLEVEFKPSDPPENDEAHEKAEE